MKRVKAACICQTLHFLLKDNPGEVFKDSILRFCHGFFISSLILYKR